MAKKHGYISLEEAVASGRQLKAGDKIYAVHKKKLVVLFEIGTEPMEKGMNILGAHIDSPRLDLKQNPLYEDGEMALLDTHYYGGIKKYQWASIPLALHGVVVKKDGTVIELAIGEKAEDPVLGISDLLIHLSGEQMQKKAAVVVEGENLNIIVGSRPWKDPEEKDEVGVSEERIRHGRRGFSLCRAGSSSGRSGQRFWTGSQYDPRIRTGRQNLCVHVSPGTAGGRSSNSYGCMSSD